MYNVYTRYTYFLAHLAFDLVTLILTLWPRMLLVGEGNVSWFVSLPRHFPRVYCVISTSCILMAFRRLFFNLVPGNKIKRLVKEKQYLEVKTFRVYLFHDDWNLNNLPKISIVGTCRSVFVVLLSEEPEWRAKTHLSDLVTTNRLTCRRRGSNPGRRER